MAQGIGFGKIILFGEHFVVYGIPAIASGINSKTIVKIKPSKKGMTVTRKGMYEKVPLGEGDENKKWDEQTWWVGDMLKPLFDELEIKERNFEYYFDDTNTIAGGGLGSSAALSVASIRALGKYFEKKLSNERVCEIAYKMEAFFHGTPSGVDNTIATYGGTIWFKKNLSEKRKNLMEKIKPKKSLEIIIGYTGMKGDTKQTVAGVRERKEKEQEKYEKIFKRAEELVFEARKSLEEGNLKKIGELMNENQTLLKEIGVSTKELDELCEIALKNGAIGAKLTGGGGGGCMIALCENKKAKEKAAKAIEKKGFRVLKTRVG